MLRNVSDPCACVTFGVFVVPPPPLIVLLNDFLVTLEHDVTRVVMTSHEY